MKRYNEIQVGMRFISGMMPNKDHRHLMEVIKKSTRIEEFTVKNLKCFHPEECDSNYGIGVGRTHTITPKFINGLKDKGVYFLWLDTEVAQILYERD